eukprot:TRINITY_DN63575_c0_g1_i1.p1 TRINITY_DN63575_c0_g1~~TRINITY_DN63575_c0_g1_i1.p1  ORF type:complete len:387 (-),score=76.13 TRINITY_DN63575_c0_g1_i1:96-1256(-)
MACRSGHLFDMQPPADMRPPVPSDDGVRCTHMDAALAKMTCAQLGYFEDRFGEILTRNTKPPSRSPLIHRGYYSRVVGLRQAILQFLKDCPAGDGCQIVNLGVGFDTLYFWLRDSPERWRDDLVVFEVDFPEVLSRKLSVVQKRQNLWPLLDVDSAADMIGPELSSSATKELRTQHCRFVSTDMRLSNELSDSMTAAGLRPDVPTLFIAECVLVYMQALHGDGIIKWAGEAIPQAPSTMLIYEQCNPDDRFGKVMVDNLMRRGCPLLSIFEYPTIESQIQRFLQRGWDRCGAADMNQIYTKYLDQKDVERIHRIELMDEFEEYHLIQAHYFILIATRTPSSAMKDTTGATPASEEGSGGEALASTTQQSAGNADDWIHALSAGIPA